MSRHESSEESMKHVYHAAAEQMNLLGLHQHQQPGKQQSGVPGHPGHQTHSPEPGHETGKSKTQSSFATPSEHNIIESLKKDPKTLDGVYGELAKLHALESSSQFKQDLSQINSDLQKSGVLPNMQIVEDTSKKEGFSAKPIPGNNNELPLPKSQEVVPAPNNKTDHPPDHVPGRHAHGWPHHDGRHHHGSRHHHDGGRHHHDGGHHHEGGHHHRGGHHHGGRHHHGERHHHCGRHHHRFEGGAYENVKAPDEATLANSVKTVLNEAKAEGLSESAKRAALASMLVESKGNPLARGDGNTSFGLFQLHRHGELTDALRQGKLHNESEAFDPAKNAHVALGYFRHLQNKYSDPGELAAAAQRPKYRAEYAHKVNAVLKSGRVDDLIKKYGS